MMTTLSFCDFGASASSHIILECPSVFTSVMPNNEVAPRNAANQRTSVRRIELLRAAERTEWLEVERLTPPDDVLNRIAQRFTPPKEWFDEEDVL